MTHLPDLLLARHQVCPWWCCFTFDNPFRRLVHDPVRILSPWVHDGDTVVDIGPGMGYFTVPLARLVGPRGRVVAVDLQQQMLDGVMRRARRHGVADRIAPHLATRNSLGLNAQADFVLAFWMVHEVPDKAGFFTQVRALLNPGAVLLMAEPAIHVSQAAFDRSLAVARDAGLVGKGRPRIFMSCAVVLGRDD